MNTCYIWQCSVGRFIVTGLISLSCIILFVQLSFVLAYEREVKELSLRLANDLDKSGKKNIAVVDFTDLQGNVTEFGRFLAEEFSVALATTDKKFEVIDRTHLKVILQEHKLSSTGIIDPETARKLGKIAGVETLLTGTITPLGGSVRVSVKILDTTTAKVIGASTVNIRKTDAMDELLGREIETKDSATSIHVTAKVNMGDFTFEALECKRTGSNVYCSVRIINNASSDRALYIGGHGYHAKSSYLYDKQGNQYQATRIQFGAKSTYDDVGQMLSPGLPVTAVLIFENISTIGDMVSLRLGCTEHQFGAGNDFFPILRNIPLMK